MKRFFAEIFIWWHQATMGTRWYTFLNGIHVGTDELGNKYYKSKKGDRRWVIYQDAAEASAITPGWHGWMHHRTDLLPSEENYQPKFWEKPHQINPTGTANAYRPDGSMLGKGERPRVTGDYDAWSPE